MNKAEQLAGVLDDFLSVSFDVQAAAVVSSDGLAMASALPPHVEEDRLAAMSAALLSLGERAAQGLDKGDLAQVYVEGSDGNVVLMAAGQHAVLVAMTAKHAKAGLVLFEMRSSAKRVAEVLEERRDSPRHSASREIEAVSTHSVDPTPAPPPEPEPYSASGAEPPRPSWEDQAVQPTPEWEAQPATEQAQPEWAEQGSEGGEQDDENTEQGSEHGDHRPDQQGEHRSEDQGADRWGQQSETQPDQEHDERPRHWDDDSRDENSSFTSWERTRGDRELGAQGHA
ncbi:MAG: roadblock/LC7 domain-containing protein [Actinomycetota bacterium]